MSTRRGLVWSAVIAVGVFQMSLPAILIPNFLPSLTALAVITTVAVLLAPHSVRFPRMPWTVVAFLGICATSALWSIDRSDTAQMTILYACMALIPAVWVAHTDTQVLLRGVAWGGLLIVVSVAVFVALDPAIYGTALTGRGAALGPYPNRNSVSFALALTLPAALMRTPRGRAAQVDTVLTIAAHVAGLLASPSTTGRIGMVAITISFVSVKVLSRLRGRRFAIGWASVGAFLIACSAAITVLWERILGLLGKSPDLSGRLQLWAAVTDVWRERPLTGYGFGAVWRYTWLPLGGSPLQRRIQQAANYNAPQGHNVLFDLLPQLGVLGAIALVLLMGGLAFRGITQLPRVPDAAGWALLTFVALVIVGFSEAGLIRPLGWFLVVAATAAVGVHRTLVVSTTSRVEQPGHRIR